ncbi:MAG: histidine kinase dimerization/phospho-acceptor domain-containing protein [Pontixanthobacter sp.]
MSFDDRLATVLRLCASGEHAGRTQYRQLLDLLGAAAPRPLYDATLLDMAWVRLGELGDAIPALERAAIVRDLNLRLRSPELTAHLANDEPEIAIAALARARLHENDWMALIPRLPVRARGFLRLRRDLPTGINRLLDDLGVHDRGLPQPEEVAPEPMVEPAAPGPPARQRLVAANDLSDDLSAGAQDGAQDNGDSEIGVLVKRIEAFRKVKFNGAPASSLPPPLTQQSDTRRDNARQFAFTTDAIGRIDWAEGKFAAMTIGTRLHGTALGERMRHHQPLRHAAVEFMGGPAIFGTWIVDAQPRFTNATGSFYGYAGLARRIWSNAEDTAGNRKREGDQLRQVLHELRTPVNAIQGFAEVIQQQLFGPTPHEYRALAAAIAGDSARILSGFDELDRLAKLETGALIIDRGRSDFAGIVTRLVDQLKPVLHARTAAFELDTYGNGFIPVTEGEAEKMAWRLLATIANMMNADEHLELEIVARGGTLVLNCELPVSLAAKDDLFAAAPPQGEPIVTAGMFGAGFALRLVRAEATAIGGGLTRTDDWLSLSLPLMIANVGNGNASQANGAA